MYIVNIHDINKKEQKNNVGIKNFMKSSFYNEFIHNIKYMYKLYHYKYIKAKRENIRSIMKY